MTTQQDNSHSGLIWITGHSGAGKTTLARITSKKLQAMGVPVVLLDGDDLRSIFGERFGYALDDRRQLAYVYSRLCHKISDCGITVVIATIAMFEAVRMENRASNERYLEVYLDVPLIVREERDPKGLYRAATANLSTALSFPSGMEEPVNPDLIIKNYGEMLPEMAASLIVDRYFEIKLIENSSQDINNYSNLLHDISLNRIQYWNSYYLRRKAPINPSSFALFCSANYFNKNCHILEFGCGNGRDSFYFSKTHRVTAIDESTVVVAANRARALQEGVLSLDLFHGEFGKFIPGLPNAVDAIYGRFVIHAMSEEAETRVLRESWRLLRNGGRLFLEFRTTRDPLMINGTQLGRNERITDHYRRYIDFEEFCKKLISLAFNLEFAVEKQGLAAHGCDDPVVGRIVAVKQI
jgi:adenylylsulfate kinase-like enzyme/SAM-dependent methyltransferase